MSTLDNVAQPLEFAMLAAKYMQTRLENGNNSNQFARHLRSIIGEYTRKGDFAKSLTLCNEIDKQFWLVRTLMEIGCEMLESGKEEVALKTIELAWENAREQVTGFPEADLFEFLEIIASYGHDTFVRSILKFALARVELMENGEFRLNCYNRMVPYLVVHWREQAELVIDHILSLPNSIPETRDEHLYPEPEIIFDMALNISKYELAWSEVRHEHFQRHLEHVQSIDEIEQERSKVRFSEVHFSRSQYDHKDRYIHKYYLPQELRASISPVDISGIYGCFYMDCDFALKHGGIPEQVPDCVIQYRDIGVVKHLDGETVRRVLLAIAAYHADDVAVLTPEENQAAMNLNAWFIEWEKDLLNRCIHLSNDMERQVRSGDNWLSDYEIDMETQFYARDDDPYSEDNMPDGSRDDIDSDSGLLCTMKHLENLPLFRKPEDDGLWYIGDDQDHNDRPRGSRDEEIFNVRHCATFHELFSHMHMPVKHAGRIGRVYTDIIVRHQNGYCIDLKGEKAIAVRDEARIRDEFVVRNVAA